VGALAPTFSFASLSFENTAIVRSIELGGSLVHVSTTYAVKALQPGQTTYQIVLSNSERAATSWFDVKVKGQTVPLEVAELGEDELRCVGSCAFSVHDIHVM
jgi:oligosaccharyltransferase complex subunit alpha (ribophorin I)